MKSCYVWALVCCAIGAAGCNRSTATGGPSPPPPEVRVAHPLEREVVEWADFTGRLEAVDFVEVRSRVSGYLESMHFAEGEVVDRDDLLFVIDPRPFEAELEKAKAMRTEAIARAEQADAQLAAAQAEKQSVDATLAYAKSEFERNEELVSRRAISESEFERKRSEFLSAQAAFSAAEAAVAAAEAGISTAKAAVASAEAAVNEAELNLSYTRIKAPVAGRISRKHVTEGNLISGGSEQSVVLTTIVSTDPVYFLFDASEQQVLRFQRMTQRGARRSARDVRYPVYLRLADEDDFLHKGYLDFIDNRFDPNTATMTARATFPNPDGILTPGMFGKLRLGKTPPFEALLLPDAAIASDQADRIVYIVKDDNTIGVRPVETGSLALGLRIIHDGLSADDRVVVAGLQRIRPGMEVKPNLSKITPDESGLTPLDAQPASAEAPAATFAEPSTDDGDDGDGGRR